jgi:hypothetical protein
LIDSTPLSPYSKQPNSKICERQLRLSSQAIFNLIDNLINHILIIIFKLLKHFDGKSTTNASNHLTPTFFLMRCTPLYISLIYSNSKVVIINACIDEKCNILSSNLSLSIFVCLKLQCFYNHPDGRIEFKFWLFFRCNTNSILIFR